MSEEHDDDIYKQEEVDDEAIPVNPEEHDEQDVPENE